MVFISHDRHLINAIGTKVIEVQGRQAGALSRRLGVLPLEEGAGRRSAAARSARHAGSAPRQYRLGAAAPAPREGAPNGAATRPVAPSKLSYQERKDLQRRYRKAEKTVFTLEERQKELAALLSDPVHISDYELLYATSEELTRVKERLVAANAEWEELAEDGGAGLEEERSSATGTGPGWDRG